MLMLTIPGRPYALITRVRRDVVSQYRCQEQRQDNHGPVCSNHGRDTSPLKECRWGNGQDLENQAEVVQQGRLASSFLTEVVRRRILIVSAC